MEAFIKNFSDYRTIKQATVLDSSLVLDSLEPENSILTVSGNSIGHNDAGCWLIVDGKVFLLAQVKPQTGKTQLTLKSPLDAFERPLEMPQQPVGASVGEYAMTLMLENWRQCPDPAYAMPYLTVSNSDTTPFVAPERDGSGCFTLPAYLRLMRRSYQVRVDFSDAGKHLHCSISKYPVPMRKVSFADGRSILEKVDFSSEGLAKITVIQEIDEGEKNAAGESILRRQRSTWYLASDGSVGEDPPAHRAKGRWGVVLLTGEQSVKAAVVAEFAKNQKNHKLEFSSSVDLQVQDSCEFFLNGESLMSHISYKRRSSGDSRYYYKSGELATTATEKLKGAML